MKGKHMKIKVITASVFVIMALSGFFWMTACSTSKSTEKSTDNTASAATATPVAPPAPVPVPEPAPPAPEFVDNVGWEKMDHAGGNRFTVAGGSFAHVDLGYAVLFGFVEQII